MLEELWIGPRTVLQVVQHIVRGIAAALGIEFGPVQGLVLPGGKMGPGLVGLAAESDFAADAALWPAVRLGCACPVLSLSFPSRGQKLRLLTHC